MGHILEHAGSTFEAGWAHPYPLSMKDTPRRPYGATYIVCYKYQSCMSMYVIQGWGQFQTEFELSGQFQFNSGIGIGIRIKKIQASGIGIGIGIGIRIDALN